MWIAVDWGTSNLRIWRMDGTTPQEARDSDRGMGRLTPPEFPVALRDLMGDWVGDVVICGMAGARQGWIEAAYRPVPCAPLGLPMTSPAPGIHIVPGLSQTVPTSDVMRGEETQIAGVLSAHPNFDGVICLPGTHSKWAAISAGEVTDFRSFMTGELFELLATKSVLRHGMGQEIDLAAFDAALEQALARPEALAARLFAIRAEGLLSGLAPDAASGRLSGLLLGAELAAAKPWWLGREVLIVGSGKVSALYDRGLRSLGVAPKLISGTDAVLAGLSAAYRIVKET
ncbi:2-dehydro-3-deoxygalactonokinase [Falsirhodobacter xinxiangensis]|uniref:2-dehydro-3-deoxygalactonokinase n=1 Tax=Falsirhodobacter xinxiangensis TaxID=2530049 RepID=UPI0015F2BB9E|nr:2-dehydro-3-deoxygalactonokinase [Rhodobacter xinxiangensis]